MANMGHRYEELHIKINSKSGLHYEIFQNMKVPDVVCEYRMLFVSTGCCL